MPKEGQVKYKDDKLQGLVLIASYGGSKTFYYGKKINARYKLKWIGRFPKLSIAAARKKAKATEFKEEIASDDNTSNLSKEEVKAILNFKTLFDKYISYYAQYKIKRWKDIIADMNRQASHLYEKPITDITKEDIQKIFNDLTKVKKLRTTNVAVERFKRIFNKLDYMGFS